MAREAGKQRLVRPGDVLFTTDSIKVTFKSPFHKQDIHDAVMLIMDGELSPRAFPPISVVEYRQRLWTLDNKRLWVFRTAEVSVITVKIVDCPDKVSFMLRTPGLYRIFVDPEYFPSALPNVGDKVATREKVPSYPQRSGYYVRKKLRSAVLDHDGFLEGGRDDRSLVLKEKLPQKKGKNKLRCDMNHHHVMEEAGQRNHRSNRLKAAAPPSPFYTKNGKVPEVIVLSDSSFEQSPIRATHGQAHRRKVPNTTAKRYTTVSDEEQDAVPAHMNYVSDTSEYHGRGLHGIRPRKRYQRMTSTRPAHHKSTQQQMPKKWDKFRETPVSHGPAMFRSYEKDGKASSKKRKSDAAYADFASRMQHDRHGISDHAVRRSKIGLGKFDASSEEEEMRKSPPRKSSKKKACTNDAIWANAHHVIGSDSECQAPLATNLESGDGTSVRTRGFCRSSEVQKGKQMLAVVTCSREPSSTEDVEGVEKGVPCAADPGTPQSAKNEKKLSNKSSAEPLDTDHAAQEPKVARHHSVLRSIACQTDDILLEDPDDLVMPKCKKRKLQKSGVEVGPSGRTVEGIRPKSAHTVKAKEVSQKSNEGDLSDGVRKLISSSDEESLLDCLMKAVTIADELEGILGKSKMESLHLRALRRIAQRPSDVGDPMRSKIQSIFEYLDKRGRSKGEGCDEIAGPASSGLDARTVAPNMQNATDPIHESGSTIPDIHKAITRCRGDAQVATVAPHSLPDHSSKSEKRKKSTRKPPKETIVHAKKSKPEYEKANKVIAKKGRHGNGSAGAHRPVDKSPGGALQTDPESQTDNAKTGGQKSGLQAGDMVYVLVSAFHMASGKPLRSLCRVGPFEFLKKINGHAATLRVPRDFPFKGTVDMSSLTKKTATESRFQLGSSASGIRMAVTVNTAPERVLLKRIAKPLRRRQKQELEYSYLVKWINLPISEATWEPAENFKENNGLAEDVEVPVVRNPFLLRNVRCKAAPGE